MKGFLTTWLSTSPATLLAHLAHKIPNPSRLAYKLWSVKIKKCHFQFQTSLPIYCRRNPHAFRQRTLLWEEIQWASLWTDWSVWPYGLTCSEDPLEQVRPHMVSHPCSSAPFYIFISWNHDSPFFNKIVDHDKFSTARLKLWSIKDKLKHIFFI